MKVLMTIKVRCGGNPDGELLKVHVGSDGTGSGFLVWVGGGLLANGDKLRAHDVLSAAVADATREATAALTDL